VYGLGLFATLSGFAHAISVITRAKPLARFDASAVRLPGVFLARPCELRLDRVTTELWHVLYGLGMFSSQLRYLQIIGSPEQSPGLLLNDLELSELTTLRITIVAPASPTNEPVLDLRKLLSATGTLLSLSLAYIGPTATHATLPCSAVGSTTAMALANVVVTTTAVDDTLRPASVLWSGSRTGVACGTLSAKAIYNQPTVGPYPLPPAALAVGYSTQILSRLDSLGPGWPMVLYERVGPGAVPHDLERTVYATHSRLCVRLWHDIVSQTVSISVCRARVQALTRADRFSMVDAALELALLEIDSVCLTGSLSPEQRFGLRVDLAVFDDEQFGAKGSVQGTVDALAAAWRQCNQVVWLD
jgi:hypothetical protein